MFKGLFDFQSRLEKIDRNGDPLKRINAVVDWSIFQLDLASLREHVDPAKGGRPPFDALLKFKMLILQSLYNLSDDNLEQQVLDRLSFMRFLGLGMGDDVPDAKTIWTFRESLKERGLVEKLFARFDRFLNQAGFTAKRGQIVDASIIEVPIRRDSREVNDKVKQGEEVAEWTPAARPQKDVDARWTRKNGDDFFGYKNHICPDAEHKLIRAYAVTPASVHDSNVFEELLRPNSDPSVFADSAYMSSARIQAMTAADSPWLPCLHEKGYTNHPLTEAQRKANRGRSRIRVRVEHVFAAQRQRAGHLLLRGIGIARAAVKIGLRNLAYNVERFSLLVVSRPGGIVS
jgi:IS5 family transposase